MPEVNGLYKCNKCGNIAELLESGTCEMYCCDQPMELLKAVQKEEGKEKHIPVLTIDSDKIKVDVGSIPHPMEKEHWINFVEVCVGGEVFRKRLNPGDEPSATFNVNANNEKVSARIYCNVHGLWPSK